MLLCLLIAIKIFSITWLQVSLRFRLLEVLLERSMTEGKRKGQG